MEMTRKFDQLSVIYLHGFASGPGATKATYWKEHLEDIGCDVSIPDLNGDSFEEMTLTSQLAIIDREVAQVQRGKQLIIIGSSMGGLLATLKSQTLDSLRALVLLAPGFGLPRRWKEMLGPEELEEWRKTGTLDVYHYRYECELPLKYGFITDAQRYQTDDLVVRCPTLVFHGKKDETVPVDESKRFANANPKTVELCLLEDGHELVVSLDNIWDKTMQFFERVLAVPTA
jgi:hypothetical protein